MKTIGICGSPRDGNTVWIMKKVFEDISRRGNESELILLKDMHIEFCNGCLICEDTKQCPIEDDMIKFYGNLSEFDQIVIGTPVYFDSIPALLKNFIDRLIPLYASEVLKGKKVYLIVVGQLEDEKGENSKNKVIQYIQGLCEIFKMVFCKAWGILAREPNDASGSKEIEKLCENIVREIYE